MRFGPILLASVIAISPSIYFSIQHGAFVEGCVDGLTSEIQPKIMNTPGGSITDALEVAEQAHDQYVQIRNYCEDRWGQK